jgi:hypothetical protein
MSGGEWKRKLHLTYAGELRSMAEKMRGEQSKSILLSIADDHEQSANELEQTLTGKQQRGTPIAL